jgi:hypothetical protein
MSTALIKKSSSLSGTKTYTGTLNFSTGAIPYFWVHFFFFAFGAEKVAKTFVRAMVMSVIVILGVQIPVLGWIPVLGGCTWIAIVLVIMMVVVAPAAWARARLRARMRVQRWSGTRLTPSSGQIAHAWQRGLVIVHGLIALFLEVIAFAIILLVVGLVAPHVLVVALRAIVAPIVSLTIVGSSIIAVTLVTSMVVVIFITLMLMVAWFMATCNRKLNRFPFLWLLVLGNSQERQLPCWLLDTAQRRQSSWEGQ